MIKSNAEQSSSMLPDLTPLLDLIFIVMVFLLLTANIQIKTLDITIPHTEEAEVLSSPDSDVVTVNILSQEPYWAIQGQSYSDWSNFSQQLLQLVQIQPEKTLVIAADKSASVESMLKLLVFLQKNQINATNIMMEDTH